MFDQNAPFPPKTNIPPATPKPPVAPVMAPPQVEDIFSQTETSMPSRIGRPLQPGEAPQMPISGDVFGRRSIWDNKLLIIALSLVGLAVIGGVVWAAVSFFSGKNATVNANLNTNSNINTNINDNINVNSDINTNIDTNVNENINAPADLNANIDTNTNVSATPIKDSDNDGLSDEEEAQLGTDPLNFDTDSDGLMDRVEVRIYKSNPLVKDTDGDGYDDGIEVINGYDPTKTGTARLFDVP